MTCVRDVNQGLENERESFIILSNKTSAKMGGFQ